MNLVYKPTDEVGLRKAIAKKVGMCPLDLDVANLLAHWHGDIDLPGGEPYMPMVHGPETLRITFAPVQSEPPYTFYFDFVPEDG